MGSPMPIPTPTERQSLVKREEMMMNGGGAKMDQKKSKTEEHLLDKSTTTNGMKQSAGEDVDEEEEEYEEEDEEEAELEDESEWTEVTATPSSSCSVPVPQHQHVPPAPLSPSSHGAANDRNNAMRKSSSSASNNIATGAGAHRTTIVATQTQTPPKDSYAILKTTTTMSGSNRKEQPAPPPPAQQQETTPEAVAIVKLPPLEPATNGDISSSSLVGRSCSLSAVGSSAATGTASSSASSKANKHVEEEKSRGSSRPSPNKEGSASGGSTREGSNSSNHSSSPFSSDRSNTGSGVSSIHTTSRSVTPKDASRSSSLYSSDQNIHCTVRVGQPGSGSNSHSSASAATSSSFTSSTTTNHSNKSGTNTNHKSAVLRAAEETVKRLRQQLPNVQAQVGPAERGKSQSVDYGKPTPLFFDPPLKSPPASAPLVQSARLFWNSITNSPHPSQSPPQVQQQMQQNHPIGSTQLHQQQFNRSRQRFIAANQKQPQQQSIDDSASPAHSPQQQQPLSPFALVAGEQQQSQQKPPFRRGESLKVGLGGGGMSFATPPRRVAPIAGEISTTKQPTTASASSSSKQDEFLFGKPAAVPLSAMKTGKPAPIAAITSASNTPESQSCCSSVTPSPSPSPIVLNSPFVTIRKQSWQQSTPPTQPTSQKESESERKAKSKLKRSTRRSTQGVTLEQLGEATGRLHAQNQHQHNGRIGGTTDRIQQANAKFNQMMEQKTSIYDPSVIVIDQLQPPSSPGCSSASSSSAYITAPNNSRHHQHEDAANGGIDSTATMPIANFSSTALLIDELNKYKQLYEKERDENDRLRLQVQELSADTRAKVSNQMRGLGWRPGVTLIQRTELPSGITYSTVTRPADRTSPPEERQPTVLTVNGIESDSRHAFEKRIAELESEVERVRELQMRNDQLKSENESLVRILAKHSRNNYNNNNNNLANIQGKPSDPTGRS